MTFFLHPERLWHLLWLLPLCFAIYCWASARRGTALRALFGERARERDITGCTVRRGVRFFRMVLMLAILTLLVGTWARPAWGTVTLPISGVGRDVMVLFDVSRSMLASDVAPTRMQHAKAFVNAITARMPGDRFGLVAFAGKAFLECPMTFDRVSFAQMLEMMDETSIPVGGTNLEQALSVGLEHLTKSLRGSQAMVLITDGEEHVGQMSEMISKLRAREIPLVVIGIGDPQNGSVIRIVGEDGKSRYLTDRNGEVVRTRLNEAGLLQLAERTKGVYIHSTTTHMGEKTAVDYLKELTPMANTDHARSLPIERWQWFIGGALLLLCLWLALGESVAIPKRRPLTAVLAFFMMPLFAVEAQETDTSPLSAREYYNRGVELAPYIDSARTAYEQALAMPKPDEDVKARANLNLGVQRHQQARAMYEEAVNLAGMDLDSGLETVKEVERKLAVAEDYYRDAIAARPQQSLTQEFAKNQQLLLNDRKRAKVLRETIEELQKQLEEARKEAQKAQQQQQSTESMAPGNDKQAQQDEAKKNTDAAKKAAEQVQENSEKVDNKEMKEQAEKAIESLKKAQEAQEKGDTKAANKHLQDAVNQLKEMAPEEAQNADSEQKQADEKKDDGEGKDGDQKSLEEDPDDGLFDDDDDEKIIREGDAKDRKQLEENAAEMLLREMAQEEKKFREQVIQRRGNAKEKQPEKDW